MFFCDLGITDNINSIMKIKSLLLFVLFLHALFSCKGPGTDNGGQRHLPPDDTCIMPKPPVEGGETRISVYVENSGSMKGYVKGVTDFESFIYDYLMKVDLDFNSNKLELNYINSKIEPQNLRLKEFIKNIEPNAFNGGSSDIASMIDMILSKTRDNDISIFISDCIFSPGKGKSAEDYLNMQKTEIEYSMSKYLKRCSNAGVLMYQLTSLYDGYYYNCEDKPKAIKAKRPYYVWVFGDSKSISKLRSAVPEEKFSMNVDHVFTMTKGGLETNYAIKRNSGDFEVSREDPKYTVKNLAKNVRDKKATFSINADFSNILMEDEYLLNLDNYDLKFGKYQIENVERCKIEGYTHTIKVSTDFVSTGTLSIKLKKQETPQWLQEKYTEECDISSSTMSRTYGLQYLVDGMRNAFDRSGEYLTELNININN